MKLRLRIFGSNLVGILTLSIIGLCFVSARPAISETSTPSAQSGRPTPTPSSKPKSKPRPKPSPKSRPKPQAELPTSPPAGSQDAGGSSSIFLRRRGRLARTNWIGIKFIWVPSGSFIMGSNVNFRVNARPVHRVTIEEGFYMGQYEVTQAQWQKVMNNNPSSFKGCESCPVESVSWEDVQEFIQRLNAQYDMYKYRLPSEAEWEYAARAGATGDDIVDLDAIAWYDSNSDNKPHPVGSKKPNAFGLNDMIGNVWEWCQDWYHDTYDGAPTDGSAWLSGGEQQARVMRGGAYGLSRGSTAHFAHRVPQTPTRRFPIYGFRLVAEVRSTN